MPTIAKNKRASFDYDLLGKYTAGIELTGHEVKSLKTKSADLTASYIVIRNGEAFLLNLIIPSFQPGNAPENYQPARTRRLLLKKNEIKSLIGKTKTGLTMVPISVYDNLRGLIKVDLAVARGRKEHDKREYLKKRESDKEIKRYVSRLSGHGFLTDGSARP